MANEKNLNQPNQPNEEKAVGAAAGTPNQTDAQSLKAQRGGEQSDQITGQTSKGAENQSKENRNPSFNDPDRNQSGRQEGNEL